MEFLRSDAGGVPWRIDLNTMGHSAGPHSFLAVATDFVGGTSHVLADGDAATRGDPVKDQAGSSNNGVFQESLSGAAQVCGLQGGRSWRLFTNVDSRVGFALA